MGLIDRLMASRAGMAPQVAQMQGAMQSPVPMPGQSPVSNAPMPPPAPAMAPPPQPGMMQRLQGMAQQAQASPLYQATLGDDEWRARKMVAMNSMRLNPDAGIAAMGAETVADAQKQRRLGAQANRTAQVLRNAGQEELAATIEANPELASVVYGEYLKGLMNPTETYETLTGAQVNEQMGVSVDPNALYNVNRATGQVDAVGGKNNIINLPGNTTETKWEEKVGETSGAVLQDSLNLGPGAQDLLATVSQLETLSPYVGQDIKALPPFLRNKLPEGMSETVDAYRSQLNGLVGSLRVAGTGSQSDREMLNMLARGGSIAASPEARAVAHNALRRQGERNLQLSDLASRATTGELNMQEFMRARNELINAPLFTADERTLIERLEAVPAGGAGSDGPPKRYRYTGPGNLEPIL